MKKVKRILALSLAIIIAAGSFEGCGGSDNQGNGESKGKSKIKISYWYAGMGIEWLDNLVAEFEAKYPEYDVVYDASSAYATYSASFGIPEADDYDLYFGTYIYKPEYQVALDDFLDATIEGESKTIREKFNPVYLANEVQQDGHIYSVTSGGGILGIVYNKKLFENEGITQLPRTTDELASVAQTFADSGIPAFCHFSPKGYWHWMANVWASQYDGYDYFKDTLYKNPTKEVLMTKDGRYEALKAMEKLITPETVLAGSNTASHIAIQTRFMNDKVAMMYTGSFMSLEVQDKEKLDNFAMMKTPVISSIIKKLTTVTDEKTLCEVIDAIDNVTDGTESVDKYKSGDNYVVNGTTVSAKDWDHIREARNSYASTYSGLSSFIPSYSDNIEGAKKLLEYFYSDEGYKSFVETTHIMLPYSLSEGTIDTSDWNGFEENQAELLTTAFEVDAHKEIKSRHKVWDVGAEPYASQNYIGELCATNAGDRKTADQIWDTVVKVFEEDFDGWISNIK